MITVEDLIVKLSTYAKVPGNAKVEVLIVYDGDVAMEIGIGDDHSAMSGGNFIERFLVLKPNMSGKRLKLKSDLKVGNA